MCPIPYYMMKRRSKDPQYLRFEMARRAKEQGIKPTAKLFDTSARRGLQGGWANWIWGQALQYENS